MEVTNAPRRPRAAPRQQVSEKQLYPPVLALPVFTDLGIRFCEEFRFNGKRVDLAGACPRTGEVYAVELKVHAWKRVLKQALLCQLFADRVYVALWEPRSRRVDREYLRAVGLGLILVRDSSATVAVPAGRSALVRAGARLAAHRMLAPSDLHAPAPAS